MEQGHHHHHDMSQDYSSASPTSVVTIPLTPPPPPPPSHQIDSVSEGTEVTLLDKESSRLYPRRCFADDEDDEEDSNSVMTPLPVSPNMPRAGSSEMTKTRILVASPETPHKVPLCGMGAACWKSSPGTTRSSPPARNDFSVEDYILALLGNTSSNRAFDWRKRFSCRSGTDNIIHETEQEETQRLQRALLKRRPSQMKAQRKHLDELRRNLHPFGASPKREKLFRSTSNQVPQSAPRKPRAPLETLTSTTNNKTTAVAAAAKTSSLWNPFACHTREVEDTILDETFLVQGSSGYDSDPECFGRTPSVRSPARIERPPRGIFALDVVSGDEHSLQEATTSIMNEKWTLILHEPNKRPQAFHVFMERGQKLARKVVPPKLSWKPLPKKGHRVGIKKEPTFSLEILDVQRILPLDEIDRKEYPLAKAGDSFLLKTINGSFCWQASSKTERDRLLALWKLTVARFGSMLVTGDDDGLEEFFAPMEAGVGFRPY